ncbi:DUF5666 domain-containing protein [Undibacterium griseum]|uniref:DUF5666 domain-containing protein n=1 Tax=Undibacterium griseum TaxID=2762295 RepID=A0ABR6YIU8_9BURK|nr:DUF5666 domain-containing protein [Undibacterium griseum]MBC3883826.1 hypothetical protein [Undibacterium griseum]
MNFSAMTISRLRRAAGIGAASLGLISLLTACGGGGSSGTTTSATTTTPVSSGGSTVTYTGPVAGLGSIVVNGVRFETVGANVHDADDPYGSTKFQSAIKLGTTVSVTGTADDSTSSGAAADIRIIGGLRGKVTAVDTQKNTLTLNGQVVSVTSTTVFEGALSSLSASMVNMYVEVYGYPQANGAFNATRIEVSATAPSVTGAVVLRGMVSAVDMTAGTLKLASGLSVSFTASQVLPKGAQIAVGTDVRVVATTVPVNNTIVATKVIVVGAGTLVTGNSNSPSGQFIKIKGIVDAVSGTTITVAGTKIDLGTLPVPAVGAVVEIKGTLSSSGTITATKIELESNGHSADVHSTDGKVTATANYQHELYGVVTNFVSLSSFKVQGVPVDASKARFEFGLSNLANNVYVEVKGTLQNGVLVATKIELKGETTAATNGNGNPSSDQSSGNRSFEIYGVLSCTSYPASCTLQHGLTTLQANLSAAVWADGGQYQAGTKMFVEVKGYLDAKGVFQVSKIEAKSDS